MGWTPVVFAVVAVALIAWALAGLWISTFRKEPPLTEGTKAALMQLARLVDEEIEAVETWQKLMADRVTAIELAVKALRERMEERGESSDEDPKPSDLAWRALTLLQREIELEGKAHAVTDPPTPAPTPAKKKEH